MKALDAEFNDQLKAEEFELDRVARNINGIARVSESFLSSVVSETFHEKTVSEVLFSSTR